MRPIPAARWGDLGLRIISAAVLIPAVLGALWAGGAWFLLLITVVGVAMAYEWTTIVHARNATQFVLHAAAALSGAILVPNVGIPIALLVILLLLLLQSYLARNEQAGPWGYLGIPYVALPAVALMSLRADPQLGLAAMFWLFAVTWVSDIGAYFVGRMIGGPRLIPAISPNKTWAGAVGAVLVSTLVAAMLARVLTGVVVMPALIGALLSIVAQAGDLFKSLLKRRHGLKDSGDLIPGHGGIIDRVDGLVAAAVAASLIGVMRSGSDTIGQGLLSW
jgi:phosphatidate cytidylyltransferase